jgi:hypothetical protein
MKREKIIALLAEHEIAGLSEAQRQSYILDWWSVGPEDREWRLLSSALQREMQEEEVPVDTSDERYNELLLLAVTQNYVGIQNEYILRRAQSLGIAVDSIEGECEILEVCPCCLYRTLAKRGEYDICRVCFWEDDGGAELDRYSSVNHMTLREGRENFSKLGASSIHDAERVRPELRDAYARAFATGE